LTEEQTMDLPAAVPDACTLPTVEQPMRVAEWDELFTCVVAIERIDARRGRLTFAGVPRLDERVRDLSRRETECCSFFDFSVDHEVDELGLESIVLDIAVPQARTDVLDAFTRRADDVRAGRRALRS
jgi:hypothetical protein